MKANYSREKKTTDIESEMTLYGMNKQLAANLPPMTEEEIAEALPDLESYIARYEYQQYFMMLCHERRDFTVFHLTPTVWSLEHPRAHQCALDVVECIQNRGDLLSMEYDDENGGYEIWMKSFTDECVVFYFFPYGEAVITY